MWMLLKPVLNQSRAVERHIVPDNNVLVLHMIDLTCCCYVVQLVQECKYECCVVRAHMGMAVEDPILCTLPWTLTIALWPMMFLPLLRVLVRLNIASST